MPGFAEAAPLRVRAGRGVGGGGGRYLCLFFQVAHVAPLGEGMKAPQMVVVLFGFPLKPPKGYPQEEPPISTSSATIQVGCTLIEPWPHNSRFKPRPRPWCPLLSLFREGPLAWDPVMDGVATDPVLWRPVLGQCLGFLFGDIGAHFEVLKPLKELSRFVRGA